MRGEAAARRTEPLSLIRIKNVGQRRRCMLISHSTAIGTLPKTSRFTVLSVAVLAALAAVSGAFAAIKPPTPGQVLNGDGDYCPAEYHSCGSPGEIPYFPPDPFDVGAA